MYENEIKSLVNTSMRYVIVCNIVETHSSRMNQIILSWNKAIRNIILDVDLMVMIILMLVPEFFSSIYWNFVLCKVRWKSHKVQK